MYYIYILKLSNFKYYTGITNNINRRLKEHINGRSISTRKHLPIALMFLTDTFNRKIARRIEKKIKNKGAKKFMIMNKFENIYSDFQKYPEMLKCLIKIPHKSFSYNNIHYITFPKYAI